MKEKTNLPQTLLEHTPWKEDVNPIWPASLFVLHRNLARFLFPPKQVQEKASQVLEQIKGALLSTSLIDQPLLLKAGDLSPVDKECLFEHYLCPESFQNTTIGQGFVIDGSFRFLALLNIEDHLQLQLLDTKGEWESAFGNLSKIETELGERLGFAYSPKFGYLTSDPNRCGTALSVFIYLHLPALVHTGELQEVLIKHQTEEVVAISMEGTLEEIVGDIVVLTNAFTVGISEENILRSLHATATKLSALEKSARVKLKGEASSHIKDEVSRAFGLLRHSYQLQTKEALNALSLLKLGIDLGWITGITDSALNDIFFKCRHGHLSHLFQEKSLDPEEIAHRRAEFLHKQLQNVELKT